MFRHVVCLALLATAGASAQAGEVYAGAGFPGAVLGYSQPFGRFALRGDFATLPLSNEQRNEEGIDYDVDPTVNRFGLFGDWFPGGGGFRLTGGVTFNRMRLDMTARGNGQNIVIGGTSYPTAADDRLDVRVEFPRTTPYLGLGWGHHGAASGLSFVFDVGASFGRAKVTATGSGTNLGQVDQSDIDAETAELRDGAGEIRLLPQVTFGMAYRF